MATAMQALPCRLALRRPSPLLRLPLQERLQRAPCASHCPKQRLCRPVCNAALRQPLWLPNQGVPEVEPFSWRRLRLEEAHKQAPTGAPWLLSTAAWGPLPADVACGQRHCVASQCLERGLRSYHKDREQAAVSGRPGPTNASDSCTEDGRAPLVQREECRDPTAVEEGPKTLAEARERQLRAKAIQGLTLPGGVVDRYLPPRDPSALLVEPHKLTKEEQRFQILFAGKFMHLALSRQLQRHFSFPPLLFVSFGEIKQLVEQPTEALLLLTDAARFGAHTTACLFVELAKRLRSHGIELPIAICDLQEGSSSCDCVEGPPPKKTRDPVSPTEPPGGRASAQERLFPAAASPHVWLLLPDGLDGEPAAQLVESVQGEKMLQMLLEGKAAQALVKVLGAVRHAAAELTEEAKEVDALATELLRCEFAEAFVDPFAHNPQGASSRGPDQPEVEDSCEKSHGAHKTLKAMGLTAALSACRKRRRQKYPSVIV
ncbi:hypothetical protein cyc_08161 [Cyclospora cayetanensis]|uniref:Uncharacterized protein n=1 Tax=Cyclospora cayetanensis TaxID=88456 RepID=A0A1D3D7T2_9EIME|nr:hypothetical protein cyc_08161 [Cyclospora cayetanensis]